MLESYQKQFRICPIGEKKWQKYGFLVQFEICNQFKRCWAQDKCRVCKVLWTKKPSHSIMTGLWHLTITESENIGEMAGGR